MKIFNQELVMPEDGDSMFPVRPTNSFYRLLDFLSVFDTQNGEFNIEAIATGKPVIPVGCKLDAHHLAELTRLNEQGYGIYFAVNQLNGKRNTQNVTSVRSLFLDLDGAPLEPVLDACQTAQIQPHAIVESSQDRFHVYFRVNDCPLDDFKGLQQALAQKFEGDKAVCDLPRLMRLPYFYHQKQDKHTGLLTQPFLTNVRHLNLELPAYSVIKLREGLKLQLKPIRAQSTSFIFNEQKTYGHGERNIALTRYAGKLITNGLDDEQVLEQVITWNETCCNPPMEREELERTIQSIRRTHLRNHGYDDDCIDDLNQKYALVMSGGKACIIEETDHNIRFLGINDFATYHRNRKVNGKPLGKLWLEHPNRRTYSQTVFSPKKAVNDDIFNIWRGFPIKPVEGDCSLYLTHLKENICSGDENCYQYLIGWMAHAIQKTDELPEVAIVMRSDQGTGKGVFARNFGKLFGPAFKHLTSREQLTGRFNSHQADSLCLFCDEITWGGRKEEAGVLKTLITEPTRMIEMKGKDSIQLANYNRVIIATNEDWVVPTDRHDRRMFILEPSNSHARDTAYFAAIEQQMQNGGLEALMYFLENHDLNNFNIRIFPKTEHRLRQKLLSMSTLESWWFDALKNGCLTNAQGQTQIPDVEFQPDESNWPLIVGTDSLYQSYIEYCSQQRDFHPLAQHLFGVNLKRISKIEKCRHRLPCGKRINCYHLPPLDDARRLMEEYLEEDCIDWED